MRPVGFERAEALRIWAVSDGKPGHENQALGLAEAIERRTRARTIVKRLSLRSPHAWLPPQLVVAPRAALSVASDVIGPPWPEIWIGCGRQTVPFGMALRGWSAGRSLVVQLQHPRVNPREFDLVIAPSHDRLDGPHVAASFGAINRVEPLRLAEARAAFPMELAALPSPRIVVLVGGKSKRQTLGRKQAAEMARQLAVLAGLGASLLVSLSRRTPAAARRVLEDLLKPHARLWYDGAGPNPYFAMLSVADHILVTADSVSMATEAAATGAPVHVVAVDGDPGKLGAFHAALQAHGAAQPFRLPLRSWSYTPLCEADRCAELVLQTFQRAAKRA